MISTTGPNVDGRWVTQYMLMGPASGTVVRLA